MYQDKQSLMLSPKTEVLEDQEAMCQRMEDLQQDIQKLKEMLEAERHLNEELYITFSEIKEKLGLELEEV